MLKTKLLHKMLLKSCPSVHKTRLNCLMEVTEGLVSAEELSTTAIGRDVPGTSRIKHKIKKVDRLLGSGCLQNDVPLLYKALSSYLLKGTSKAQSIPIVVDLCYLRDDKDIQMLSAEVVNKKRTLPIYSDVFKEGQMKGRVNYFLKQLHRCIPSGREVIIILDAGFYDTWFTGIESLGWHWIARIRQGRGIYIKEKKQWESLSTIQKDLKAGGLDFGEVLLTKRHKHPCRLVGIKKGIKGRHKKTTRSQQSGRRESRDYSRSHREGWLLASNLPKSVKAKKIISYYEKRMQIEESFRDTKSHRFGLSARYNRSHDVNRWRILMLLVAIVKVIFWLIGATAKAQGLQFFFQANTNKNNSLFSNFFLGKLVVKHCFKKINFRVAWNNLPTLVLEGIE